LLASSEAQIESPPIPSQPGKLVAVSSCRSDRRFRVRCGPGDPPCRASLCVAVARTVGGDDRCTGSGRPGWSRTRTVGPDRHAGTVWRARAPIAICGPTARMERSGPLAGVSRRPSGGPDIDPRAGVWGHPRAGWCRHIHRTSVVR